MADTPENTALPEVEYTVTENGQTNTVKPSGNPGIKSTVVPGIAFSSAASGKGPTVKSGPSTPAPGLKVPEI